MSSFPKQGASFSRHKYYHYCCAQHKDVFIPSEYLRHINFIKSCQHGTSILSILQTVSNTLPHFGHTLLKYEWHQLQTCIWQTALSRKCIQEILLAEIKITGNFTLVTITACTGTLTLTNWGRDKMAAIFQMTFSYIPSSAIRRSGSARYFSVRHYRIAKKFHNNDADSSLRSMFTFSRPITALLTGALTVQGHGQVTWPDTSIWSFIG